MMYRKDRISTIYYESSLAGGEILEHIFQHKEKHTDLVEIQDLSDLTSLTSPGDDIFNKRTLVVSRFQGKFLSSCPGSDGMVCCRYFVINTGPGCIYDCHYCFLQSFLNTPFMHLYGNMDEMLAEIDDKLNRVNFPMRIGTGEYSDSLALEDLTGISGRLVTFFSEKKNATLELKTKSSLIDPILNLKHGGNTVISWSLNPQKVIDAVEEGASALEDRIQAAQRAVQAGYRIAFHFDPMIYYPGWEEDYHEIIDILASNLDPWSISWISLGTFRYSPGLKEVIQKRFLDDNLTRVEMLSGSDGKFRYLKQVRIEMYRSMKKKIQDFHPDLFSYICMDTRNIWKTLEGSAPDSAKNLDERFEKRRTQIQLHSETAIHENQ